MSLVVWTLTAPVPSTGWWQFKRMVSRDHERSFVLWVPRSLKLETFSIVILLMWIGPGLVHLFLKSVMSPSVLSLFRARFFSADQEPHLCWLTPYCLWSVPPSLCHLQTSQWCLWCGLEHSHGCRGHSGGAEHKDLRETSAAYEGEWSLTVWGWLHKTS